jgi:hypothetical protein
MAMTDIKLRAVLYRQGDSWIVQGLEYDLVAHAKTMEGALQRFVETAKQTAARSKELSGEAFAGIAAAPERFFILAAA